ncbi:hypothetical protein PCANC_23117 [Puccinia coronata f. sp. avenae]|uniref:Uncharacterized protein n=1 Tax=Puccinia coronata f. sp. avenae TaxID=200324 RepID=A0A2N5TSK9_9BASI|nr:hypothetical protein PCANC_27637 [Puccinia coronata f. sp. avenae]PLW28480.1 hypothetical protein PCANC_23117 [Puccinia coronata f. sp. avenae]
MTPLTIEGKFESVSTVPGTRFSWTALKNSLVPLRWRGELNDEAMSKIMISILVQLRTS